MEAIEATEVMEATEAMEVTDLKNGATESTEETEVRSHSGSSGRALRGLMVERSGDASDLAISRSLASPDRSTIRTPAAERPVPDDPFGRACLLRFLR
jgi:hypothetical protein